jgi:RNA 3'-phosphate cyclase
MMEIDGSYGEGGGSLFRYSLALSALSGIPVKIRNIRAKRDPPGLKPQHLAAAKVLAEISNAKVSGLAIGSTSVEFIPGEVRGGRYKFDVGTAGSVSLIIQAVLPVVIRADSPIELELIGGTDVRMAPPIDYMRNVFLKNLSLIGINVELQLIKRGHYPRGGGRVILRINPISKIRNIEVVKLGEVRKVRGLAHAVKLKRDIAERIALSATKILKNEGFNPEVNMEWSEDNHLGPGAGITVWAESNSTIGADSLGERGKPSEIVGKEAALKLIDEIRAGMAFDRHTGDMLIPYLAISSGRSAIGASNLTLHTISNIWLCEKFFNIKFDINGERDRPCVIEVVGKGI